MSVYADGHAERPVKKQRMSNGSAAAGVKLPGAIMLDIEGTVASISFVTEVQYCTLRGDPHRGVCWITLALPVHQLYTTSHPQHWR